MVKNMFSNIKNKQTKILIISSYVFLLLVLGLSVGFSAFCNELGVKNISAIVKIKADIRITSVSQVDSYGDAYSTSLDYNVSNINGAVTLPNEDSYVDYNVKIVNLGNVEMGIKSISSDNENLSFELLDYTLGDKLCSLEDATQCTLGAVKNLVIRVKWNEGKYNSDNTSNNFVFDFDFQNYHKVTVDDSLTSIITDYPEEVLNTSDLVFKYAGNKFNSLIYMDGKRINDYIVSGDTITVKNVTGEIAIKSISYGIDNGSFEVPSLSGEYKYFDAYLVDSWNTTATADKLEFGRIFNNVSPHLNLTKDTATTASTLPDGNQFAEINATEKATLFQNISVTEGETYTWDMFHRGRSGQEVMALVIGNRQENEPTKASKNIDDQFNVMIDWLFEKNRIDLKYPTKKVKYTVYSPKFNSTGGFEEVEGDLFSYTKDDIHTEEWNIWLISSSTAKWFNYSDSYTASSSEIIFAFASIISARSDDLSYGNLIENISFKNNDTELIVNGSFEDITSSKAYAHLNAQNSSSPASGIGWSTTATDKKVEIGNFELGKTAYGISTDLTSISAYVKDGINFLEINAEETGTVYQDFLTKPGEVNEWSVTHRGRDGIDYIAMIIGPSQSYNPSKASKSTNDQFMKLVDWVKNNIDINNYGLDVNNEGVGCSNKIIVYSSKFSSVASFETSDDNAFSLTKDDVHTEKWNIWIMGTNNDDWKTYGFYDEEANYDYTYVNDSEKSDTIIAFTNYSTWGMRNNDSKGHTVGNLIDYVLWS